MIRIFTWPDRGLHKFKFLIHVLDEAKYTALRRNFWIKVAVTPIDMLLSPDVLEIKLKPWEGNVMRHPQDESNEAVARRIAMNRAIRTALEVQNLSDVWDETYHALRKQRRIYCMRRDQDSLVVSSSRSKLMSLPGRCDGVAPLSMLPRIVAHAIAQRATVDLKLGFRHNLTLHYGKTNCTDGRKGWTMIHSWPKPTGEGEPDDFGMTEQVFRDDKTAAEGFAAKAQKLLEVKDGLAS
jgi:hypothetical protein